MYQPRYNGNGYSDEWVAEAEKRGLPNIKSMVEAIPALTTDKAVELFGKFSVFTKAELESRAEIKYENYAKAINIEAKAMIDIAAKQIIPAVVKYTKELADTVLAVKEAGADASVQAEMLADISGLLTETKAALKKLEAVTEEAAGKEEGEIRTGSGVQQERNPVCADLKVHGILVSWKKPPSARGKDLFLYTLSLLKC